MKKDLKKDLMEVLEKYGLKADGVEPAESKTKVVKEPVASDGRDSEVTADLAKTIAKKLATIISKNKGYGENTKKDLDGHLKQKIYTNWGGLREIEYPSDLTALSKEEKIVTFFKALVFSNSHPESQQVIRALVEGTDDQGGYEYPFFLQQYHQNFFKSCGNLHLEIGD